MYIYYSWIDSFLFITRGVESFAMKAAAIIMLFIAFLAPELLAQTQTNPGAHQPYEIQISAGVAEKLLVHKVEIICPRIPMAARVTGT